MMIDLHSHILPGADDGASSMDMALSMLEAAASCGVRKIAATVHCNIPGRNSNYYTEALAQKFRLLQDNIKDAEIPIELLPGMEVFANSDVPELLKKGKLLTLNCTKYLLMEFGFNESVPFTFSIIQELISMGCVPVVAHPERYPFVQRDPNIVFEWMRIGACTQINKGSLLGRFGTSVGETAMQLLQHDMATIIASDAHDTHSRTTCMKDSYEYVQSIFGDDYAQVLFFENPRRIITDTTVLSNGPMPI
ncbi:MAG: hypothetical protein IJO48_05470 [Clostridia bacterium]|nr:hypothetical protein [Clostridia bacterium]